MKQAVILVGGKQYIATEGETLRVDLLPEGTKELETDALLLIDGDKTTVGTPTVKGVKVKAKVVEAEVKGDKVRVIRYHSKKRVHKRTVIANAIAKSKSRKSLNKKEGNRKAITLFFIIKKRVIAFLVLYYS